MNILQKYTASSKNTSSQAGKAASISKSSYQKAVANTKSMGFLRGTVTGDRPMSLPQPDLKNPRKFNSKYDLAKQPTKYTDTIK